MCGKCKEQPKSTKHLESIIKFVCSTDLASPCVAVFISKYTFIF